MDKMTRRKVIQTLAATAAALAVGQAATASEPHALGGGACTKCHCQSYYGAKRDYAACRNCGHYYIRHRSIG
jgi:hypothetical protein